ncbi:MAG: hypothetical protein WBP12_00650 [Candidatus Saccharimonas sp.]
MAVVPKQTKERWPASAVTKPETISREAGIIEYALPSYLSRRLDETYSQLPEGYGLIGGAARQIAFDLLTNRDVRVRDLDIAAFHDIAREKDIADDVRSRLSYELMPEDYAYGHGIRVEPSMAEYMASRDFTINQLAAVRRNADWRLYMTDQAQIDLPRGVIRPTVNEHNQDWHLGDKLAVKAVLLETVLRTVDDVEGAAITGIDMRRYAKEHGAEDFHLALGLQKAYDWGDDVPSAFVQALENYGFIRHYPTIEQLMQEVEETGFDFRGAADMARRRGETRRRLGGYVATRGNMTRTIAEAVRSKGAV